MSNYFFEQTKTDEIGLAIFLNAGDPPLAVLPDVLRMLDEHGVDCVELAVPFRDSVSDGQVIKDSAERALRSGVGLRETLDCVAAVRPSLQRLRIALFADWQHCVAPLGIRPFVRAVAESGCDALLVHATPAPRRHEVYETVHELGVGFVSTCYAQSRTSVMQEAIANATAYLYLVSRYGRSGSGQGSIEAVVGAVGRLKELGVAAPTALGFGIRTCEDIARAAANGADAAIVGSAFVSIIGEAHAQGVLDPVDELAQFVRGLRTSPRKNESALVSAGA